MGPQTDDFDRTDRLQYLIHQAVLDVDPPGIGASEVADEFLIRRRGLIGVVAEEVKQGFGFRTESRRRKFLGVLLSLRREDERPLHHVSAESQALTGVAKPLRIDSRIPGIDTRYNVS